MEYPNEVRAKIIPVSELISECNKSNTQWKNNNYYSSTDPKGDNSDSEYSVEFNYAEVASENENNDEAELELSMFQPHDDEPEETVSSASDESRVIKSVTYFNSLKKTAEDTTDCKLSPDSSNHRTLPSNIINQIEDLYNYQLQQYIHASGNTALYKYMQPDTRCASTAFVLPEYVSPAAKIRIDASLSQLAISPVFHKYQLLGDSQLVRFSEVVLRLRRWREKGARPRIGYCVSGQCVAELGARIRASECRLHSRVIVLIGTNDMRRNADVMPILEAYADLVEQLKHRCDKIVLVTVPPLPFVHDQDPKMHIYRLKIVNEFIRNLANENNIFVVDLCSVFISFDNTVSKEFFEKFLRDDKVDLIHLNKSGYKMLRTLLDTQYFEKYKC